MAGFYDDMAQVVTDLLTEFGAPATLTRAPTSFDEIEGEVAGSPPSLPTLGIVLNRSSKLVQDRLIAEASDLAVVNDSQAPLISDRFVFPASAGKDYAIMQIDEVNPAGTALAYFLHLAN